MGILDDIKLYVSYIVTEIITLSWPRVTFSLCINFFSEGFTQRICILVIERTAPPSLFQTCVSPNLSPCSLRQSGSWSGVLYVHYRQSRKRLGETLVWKTQQDAVRSIANIYSLILVLQYFMRLLYFVLVQN